MAFFFYKGHDLEVLQAIFLVDKLGQDIMPQKITKFHDDPF